MFEEMSDRDFVDFLAGVWEQRGWETAISEAEPGQFMVTGDREDGERGLMLVVPGESADVAGKPVQTAADLCDEKNVDLGVVATRGTFSDEAEQISDLNDIYLLDTTALEATVAEEGLQDLVEKYSNGSGGILGKLAAPLRFLSVLIRPSRPRIPTKALTVFLVIMGVAAVVIGGIQVMGVGLGGGIPDIGPIPGIGGDSDDMTMTAVSLTGSSEDSVEIAWNAKTQSTVVPPNGTKLDSPEGEKIVVVDMTVTNGRPASSNIEANVFAFAANDEIRGPRMLNETAEQFPLQLAPNESRTVWIVFTIDAEADSGTLLALPSEGTPPIRFERNRSVETDLGNESSGFEVLIVEPGRT